MGTRYPVESGVTSRERGVRRHGRRVFTGKEGF